MSIGDKIKGTNSNYRFTEKIISFCIRYRIYLIFSILIVTGVFLNRLTHLEANNDFEHWFDHTKTNYTNYSDYVEAFGNDQYFILVYRNDNLISKSGINTIRDFSESILELDEVEELVSLHTINFPSFNQYPFLIQPLIPAGEFNRRQLENQLDKYRDVLKNVLSEDRKSTVFHVYQKTDASVDSLYEKLNQLIEATGDKQNFYFYNGKVLSIEATNLAKAESTKFFTLSLIVIFSVLIVIFRNIFYALIPLIISIISTIITLGIFAVNGGSLDMLSGIIPLIILVMSSTFSVHFLSRIKQYYKPGSKSFDSLRDSLNDVFLPGLLSNLTTSLALLSFAFSSIVPIRVFGIYCAIGITMSFAIGTIIIIIMYSSLERKFSPQKTNSKWNKKRLIDQFLNSRIFRSPLVLFTVIGLTFISIYGISQLKVETDVFRFFKSDHKVVRDKEMVETWFKGTQPLDVVFSLESIQQDSLPKLINEVGKLGKQLESKPEVDNCMSLSNINTSLGIENIPGDLMVNLLNSSNYIRHFYSNEKQKIRLAVNTSFLSNQESMKLADEVRTEIDEFFQNDSPEYYISGASLLYADLNSDILHSQITSLGGSFVVIFLLITLIFQSRKISLTGILPNILPVINTLGIMGLMGIKLDVGTVLVASISLGMSVDDTIFLFHGYLRAINSPNPISIALNRVAVTLFRTTIIICFGFLIMVFSKYQPVYFLGIFVAVNIFMALLYDLILVPWIVLRFKGSSKPLIDGIK